MKKLSQILLMVFCLTGCFGNQTTPTANPSSTSGPNPTAAPTSTPVSTSAPEPKPTLSPSTPPTATPSPSSTQADQDGETEDETPESAPEGEETVEFYGTKPDAEPAYVPHPSGKKEVNILFLSPRHSDSAMALNVVYNHLVGKTFGDEEDILIPLPIANTEQKVNVDRFKGISRTKVNPYTIETDNYIINFWVAPRSGEGEIDEKAMAAALEEKQIKAICVVVLSQDFARDNLSKSAIANIGRMLPKSFEKNVIGIFNNAGTIQKKLRPSYAEEISELLALNQTATTIFLNGILGNGYEDHWVKIAEIQWNQDKGQVQELLEQSAALIPVSGKGIGKIQAMIAEMAAITQQLNNLQEKEIYLKLLELESKHSYTFLKNQDFAKAGEKEYGKNLSSELRNNKIKELRTEQRKLVRQHKKLETSLNKYAIAAARSPYLKFLESKASTEPEITTTKLEKTFEKAFWEAKLKGYKSIQ